MDEGFSLIEVICWTLAGLVVGGGVGWQMGVAYEARSAARKAVAKIVEVEDYLLHDQVPKWDGHDRRKDSKDQGRANVMSILVICLLVAAGLSAAWGVVVAGDAQKRAECFTNVNEEFARTIEIRAVEAGDLERQAALQDRQALDRLVASISSGIDSRMNSGEAQDARPAFREYRERRQEADALREEADLVRENNPYPSADECRRTS